MYLARTEYSNVSSSYRVLKCIQLVQST